MTDTAAQKPAMASGTFRLGRDLTVYRLGFGAMRITGQGIWGPPRDHDEAIRVLRRAVALGVNLIDTADSYGPDISEELIAEALYPYPEGLVIATKGGQLRPGPGQWSPNGRPEHLRQALEGSLRRLRLEQIDLYQLHRPDPEVPFEESVGALAAMQKEGKIRHIGLSNVSTDQLARAQRIVSIVSVQNRYNLADRSSEDVLRACERENIGFIPWAPIAVDEASKLGSALQRIAQHHDASPTEIALAWLLHHSSVMLPIPGTSAVAHLEENLAAAGIKLSQQEMEQLDRR
jgi:aryl-alcohol dehydrogenase-like predicted oxidoreductase